MKKLLFVLCVLPALVCAGREHPYLAAAREMGWSDVELAKLEKVIAARRSMSAQARGPALAAEREQPKVDPDLERLRRDAQRRAARYAVLKRTVTRHEPGRTNLVVRAMAASLAQKIEEARRGWTNALLKAESVRARLVERREEYVRKRDSAALPTTKAIYQAFIDAIDDLIAKFDAWKRDDE